MIKELEDYNWFPKILRRFQMDYIGSIVKWSDFYQPLVPVLQELIDACKIETIQDLCSGSGAPAIYVQQKLKGEIKLILSDKFPDVRFENTGAVKYLNKETDLMLLHPESNRCYSMYNAFHHFSDEDKLAVINKMVVAQSHFVIAEIFEPGFFTAVKILFTTTVLQLLTAPFVKPFSLVRLLFTYLLPVNLFIIPYDGIVSVIKSRSVKQYQQLLKDISNDNYQITVNKFTSRKGVLVYIKGHSIKQ